MKIRGSIHLGGKSFALHLFPILSETYEHVVLKLAASLFFHEQEPRVLSSPQQHSALAGQDFAPDLIRADDTNHVTLWIECGKTTVHKLDKITKRFRDARIVMLTALPREGEQMAEMLQGARVNRVEIWSFAVGEFDRFCRLVQEQNDIIGEATETSLNLVINGEVFMTELKRIA